MMKQEFAVIGDPIAHSLSPLMHNAAFRALNLNADYQAIHVLPAEIPLFIRRAREQLRGFNITVPHKQAILPFLDQCSEKARLCESVNTVRVLPGGLLAGDSTDGYGLEAACAEAFGISFSGRTLCFIGCGGVVPALAFHAAFAGVKSIMILNRSLDKAEALCSRLTLRFPALHCACAALGDRDAAGDFLRASDLAVQCTSLGLKNTDPAPLDPGLLPDHLYFFDTIYKETALYHAARERGLRCANGFGMLLHQGAKAFELWFDRPAPLPAMRAALLSASK